MFSQKNLFLKEEGDSYFKRNYLKIKNRNYAKDRLTNVVQKVIDNYKNNLSILTVGCCDGGMLNFLSHKYKKIKCFGIDPSSLAIKSQKNKKIILKKATADKIPFKSNKFDILVFNFCLYLCDDNDLFKIVFETDRVTKKNSFLIIYDFHYPGITYVKYKHLKKIFSRKMDNSKIFLWHPNYSLIRKKIMSRKGDKLFRDENLNKVSISVLKKSNV